jgi:hypothetical protein
LHRVAEEIRGNYPDVDKPNFNVKRIFIKAPLRVQKFKEIAPSMHLPPEPVLTRWGTWLQAAVYYCINYSETDKVVSSFSDNEASSIKVAKLLFSNNTLSGNLAYIKSNFSKLATTITQLETTGVEVCRGLELVKNVESELNVAHGTVDDNVFPNYKVYSIEMKDIQQSARLVTFLVVSRQHSRKTTQNLAAMISHFLNIPQLLPVMWKGVFPIIK